MAEIGKWWRFICKWFRVICLLTAWAVLAWLCHGWGRGLEALLTIGLGLYLQRFWGWRTKRLAMLERAEVEAPKLTNLFGTFLRECCYRWWLRYQWREMCKAKKLVSPHLKSTPKLHHLESTINGDLTASIFPGGVRAEVSDFQHAAPTMAGQIRGLKRLGVTVFPPCKEVVVRVTEPGNARVDFIYSEPLKRKLGLADLPLSPDRRMLVLGIGRDGKPLLARKDFSMMIGGMPGQGKSNQIHLLIAQLLADGEHVWLYISDAKGGAELSEYGDEDKIGVPQGRLTVQAYAKNSAQTKVMLEKAAKDLAIRQSWLGKSKTRKLTASSEANPRAVVILDEQVLIQDVYKRGTDTDLGTIYASGRNALFTVWGCTQDGRAETIPASLRTLIPTRQCFATDTPDSTDCVLGKGAEARKGARCSDLDPQKDQGMFFTGSEDARWMMPGRAPLVPDAAVALIAKGMVPPEMAQRRLVGAPPKPYVIYRPFDDSIQWARLYECRPVYIGITNDWERREAEHKRNDWKWCEMHQRMENYWAVHVNRVVVTPLKTTDKKTAEAIEEKAIRGEYPVFNDRHNGASKAWARRVQSWFYKPAATSVEPSGVVLEGEVVPADGTPVWPPRTRAVEPVNGHAREHWSE
jgi:hypothetical protein